MFGGTEAAHLASSLAPSLVDACDGRLSDIRWFTTDWQRGGAATGYAKWTAEPGDARDVVVKVPVGPTEHRTLLELSKTDAPTPRVAADGWELGAYHIGWIVMERLPGEPLAGRECKEVFQEVADAAGRFYQRAQEAWAIDPAKCPRADWNMLLDRARASVKQSSLPNESRWNEALKKVQKALPSITRTWDARPINCWRHGDLHCGNAMRREDGSRWGEPGCVLLDFAEMGLGHWVEDAIYLERLYWARPDTIKGVKPVSLLAKARRERGLDNGDDYGELANIRRVLVAACVPAFLEREGSRGYLEAALGVLERLIPVVAK